MSDSLSADAPVLAPSRERFDWNRVLKVVLPLVLFALTLWAWERYVTVNAIPAYVLPAPSAIWATLLKDWPTCWARCW
jgi:ABC-type nitrate/sulfonate/bicarbonate transport system permease component